jgi:Arc/MetJ family transcription regulator
MRRLAWFAVPDRIEDVRRHCAVVAARARWVHIEAGAARYTGGTSGLDPALHLLDAEPEAVARYVLIMDTTNFGSGWFGELDVPSGEIATAVFARRLTAHARARAREEPWTAAELRVLDVREVAEVLGQDPGHELLGLYAGALRELGTWLGERTAMEAIAAAGGSAARLVGQLVDGMPAYADPGLLKRAQITVNDLVLAGVARFADIDRLTIFADDLVPHVLRRDGVLHYAPALAERIDAGDPLRHGEPMEVEVRACAVEACERLAVRVGVAPRRLDNWLWNRGTELLLDPGPMRPHRTLTTAY